MNFELRNLLRIPLPYQLAIAMATVGLAHISASDYKLADQAKALVMASSKSKVLSKSKALYDELYQSDLLAHCTDVDYTKAIYFTVAKDRLERDLCRHIAEFLRDPSRTYGLRFYKDGLLQSKSIPVPVHSIVYTASWETARGQWFESPDDYLHVSVPALIGACKGSDDGALRAWAKRESERGKILLFIYKKAFVCTVNPGQRLSEVAGSQSPLELPSTFDKRSSFEEEVSTSKDFLKVATHYMPQKAWLEMGTEAIYTSKQVPIIVITTK